LTQRAQRIVTEYKYYKYKGYKLRTKQCLSLTRLANKIFLHTRTKRVRPSEIFCTSRPLFSVEKRPVPASCSSSSAESSSKGTARSVSESDGVSDEVGSRQNLLFRLFEGPKGAFDASQLVLDLVTCLIFFF